MQQQKPQPSLLQALDAGLVVQLQALTAQLTAAATANSLNPLEQRVSSFNKVMLQSANQKFIFSLLQLMTPNLIMLSVYCRNFWVLLILGMILSVERNLKRTLHHLSCEFSVFLIKTNIIMCLPPSLV